MLTKGRVIQLLVMLIVLLGLFFWRTFTTDPQAVANSGEEVTLVNEVRCDYQSACEFITEQGAFLLTIKDVPIKAEQWIYFQLTTPNAEAQVGDALIVGKSMFMGEIPVTFKQSEAQLFSAKAIVAACMHEVMIWTLQITVNNGELQQQVTFDFAVRH